MSGTPIYPPRQQNATHPSSANLEIARLEVSFAVTGSRQYLTTITNILNAIAAKDPRYISDVAEPATSRFLYSTQPFRRVDADALIKELFTRLVAQRMESREIDSLLQHITEQRIVDAKDALLRNAGPSPDSMYLQRKDVDKFIASCCKAFAMMGSENYVRFHLVKERLALFERRDRDRAPLEMLERVKALVSECEKRDERLRSLVTGVGREFGVEDLMEELCGEAMGDAFAERLRDLVKELQALDLAKAEDEAFV